MSQASSDTESEYSAYDMTEPTISRIDPNFGLSAITSTLIPQIYESFFSQERYGDNQFRKELLPKVVDQIVLITTLLSSQ